MVANILPAQIYGRLLIMHTFITRLWRHVCLKATGAPDRVLQESAKTLDSDKGIHLTADSSKALHQHILEKTKGLYSPPYCITCKNYADCELQDEQDGNCLNFKLDSDILADFSDQVFKALEILEHEYGYNAAQTRVELKLLFEDLDRRLYGKILQFPSRKNSDPS